MNHELTGGYGGALRGKGINYDTGWFTVAGGATLLAADQTWRLTERYDWPAWIFWLLMVAVLGLCVLNTAARMIRHERVSRPGADPGGDASPG